MRVGLTYDLRSEYLAAGYSHEETAEFDRDDTIDSIESSLRGLGHDTVRIGNIRSLVGRLAAGDRWDMVFNICEGMHGLARESQVPALLEAYGIPCTFSDSFVLALTMHKGCTKTVIKSLNLPTPDFAVANSPADVEGIKLPFPLFVKPVAEGTGKGVSADSKVGSMDDLRERVASVIKTYRQPALVETFMPGREYTVGIVGTGDEAEAVGTVEVVLKGDVGNEAYSYQKKEECEDLVLYILAEDAAARECEKLSLKIWKALGCRDAGRIDIRLDRNGVPNFLEVNPLAGLHPEHSDLPIICSRKGISYGELIRRIMDSAVKRAK